MLFRSNDTATTEIYTLSLHDALPILAIIAGSTLSFLGLGFPPDIPTWGRILYDAKDYLDVAPHWALFPGGALFLVVLSINYVGDGLRDALDPRKVL